MFLFQNVAAVGDQYAVPAGMQMVRPPPSTDFNKFIQELAQMKKDFDLYLQGKEEVKDENGNAKTVQMENPRVNESGRKAVMSWIEAYVNPNTYLSENKDYNVVAIYQLENKNVADELVKNHAEFELSIENFHALHSRIMSIIFHALQKSMTDKKYIFGSTNTSYAPQQPEKKGWLAQLGF